MKMGKRALLRTNPFWRVDMLVVCVVGSNPWPPNFQNRLSKIDSIFPEAARDEGGARP